MRGEAAGPLRWPFTAREAELRRVRDALVRHGTVVIGGPQGVGKSRLAREVLSREQGAAWVRATLSSREIPLGVFAPLLPAEPGGGSELSAVRSALERLSDGRRSVLGVDDAHLLDPVSATVVGQLAASGKVRLLLTLRSGEPAPDAVSATWRDGGAARLDLDPMNETQVRELLDAVLDGPLDAQADRRLHAVARGNVLWLRHLIEGERAAGRLARDPDGAWRWRGATSLSPALRDLVAARVGDLSTAQRRVLELLWLAEPLDLALLGRLTGDDAVEEVADRGLVAVERVGTTWETRLAHPLYGEVVREGVSLPRARRLRGELSTALGAAGERRADDDLRRAVLDLGSDRPPDPQLLLLAAMRATGLGDLALAERLLRASCEAGGGFDARLGLAHLLSYLLRTDEAEIELSKAADEARDDAERVRVGFTRAQLAHFIVADPDRALEIVVDTENRLGPEAVAEFGAMRATIAITGGDIAHGVDLAWSILERADLSPQATTLAVWAWSYARALRGFGVDLGPVVERGLAAARDNPETAALQANIGFSEVLDADLRGEPELAARRLDWVHSLTGPEAATLTSLYTGRMAISAGQPRMATRMFEAVLPTFPGIGGGWGAWLRAQIAQCHGMLGDARAAREWVTSALDHRHPTISVLDWEIDLAHAWAAAAAGARGGAVAHLVEAADTAGDRGLLAVEVLLRQTAVRFGRRGESERLRALDRIVDSCRSRLAAAHAAALDSGDADALLAVAGALEESGMGLEAADAAGQAAGLARASGRLATATAAGDRARALAVRGDDARTPAVIDGTTPLPLSEREREVATLAAEGLTNRQVADRLHVSVRTVESHIYRACSRLGISDRAALLDVVVPRARRGAPGRSPGTQ